MESERKREMLTEISEAQFKRVSERQREAHSMTDGATKRVSVDEKLSHLPHKLFPLESLKNEFSRSTFNSKCKRPFLNFKIRTIIFAQYLFLKK